LQLSLTSWPPIYGGFYFVATGGKGNSMFNYFILARRPLNLSFWFGVFFMNLFAVIGGASAMETQCFRLNAETVCATSDNCYGTSDCTVDCNGVSVTMVARCSSSGGAADETIADDLVVSSTATANVHCWCAMVTPYSSKYVYRYQYNPTGYTCAYNCARGCRNAMIFNGDTDVSFRRVIYSSVLGE